MNTTTTTLDLGRQSLMSRRSPSDWLFAALVIGGAAYAFRRYGVSMDGYEKGILFGAVPALIALGWFWGALRLLAVAVGGASLLAINLYARTTDSFGADLVAGGQVFWLKYLLSSQSAILWMGTLFFMSTLFYWFGFFSRQAGVAGNGDSAGLRIGSGLAWAAVFMALTGTMVRWYESHQIAPLVGHIPVSNLYEVFVLFCWLTTLFYLYYEAHYKTRTLGPFVMLVISSAVGFLAWYIFAREAHEIQPLLPALQSWWMKLHVPANFIGYGTFALSAMVALACLLKTSTTRNLWIGLVGLPAGVLVLMGLYALFGAPDAGMQGALTKGLRMIGGTAAFFAVMILLRTPVNARTPTPELMDDLMYKAIAVGFAFFTIATVLGAFWAAEAWGGYWS